MPTAPAARRAYKEDVRHFMQMFMITTHAELRATNQAAVIAYTRKKEAEEPRTICWRLSVLSASFKHLMEHQATYSLTDGRSSSCHSPPADAGAEIAYVFGKERLSFAGVGAFGGQSTYLCCRQQCAGGDGVLGWAERPTCGCLRRALWRVHYSDLPTLPGQIRQKNVVTTHRKTGVEAHQSGLKTGGDHLSRVKSPLIYRKLKFNRTSVELKPYEPKGAQAPK